ncbi:MAG: M1 family metallopeptidase [Pantoea ananatis]|uniref:hypothetical protein n=1 Tax=Pantoea ananas TaxID=553 RepID=UPI0013B80A1E|nr:hypothetical protein [Pantoea ananatis]MCW1834738.1 hypothetical protein [Pantoea ananatis]NEK83759.1 M1 family metallopeptidase [Pantoea ananatis]
MKHVDIVAKANGVPMVSDKFDAQTLVKFVAHYRHALLNHFDNISDYLKPENIEYIYRDRNESLGLDYPDYGELSDAESVAVKNAVSNILKIMPEWKAYFSIPVSFKRLTASEHMVSLTNHNIPQVIFFGAKAFKSEDWLEEVIIHEMAHIWLGLICEIDSFHEHTDQHSYTLPSGTKGKDARGVIFATHFAACVLKYMDRKRAMKGFTDKDDERFSWLLNYFSGCMSQLAGMDELKPSGKKIVSIMGDEVSYA